MVNLFLSCWLFWEIEVSVNGFEMRLANRRDHGLWGDVSPVHKHKHRLHLFGGMLWSGNQSEAEEFTHGTKSQLWEGTGWRDSGREESEREIIKACLSLMGRRCSPEVSLSSHCIQDEQSMCPLSSLNEYIPTSTRLHSAGTYSVN